MMFHGIPGGHWHVLLEHLCDMGITSTMIPIFIYPLEGDDNILRIKRPCCYPICEVNTILLHLSVLHFNVSNYFVVVVGC